MTFLPSFKDEDYLKTHQLEGLQWTVNHAYSGSEFYKEHLNKTGVGPGDIRTLDDIEKLPFTTAKDLGEGYPFPLLSVPLIRYRTRDLTRLIPGRCPCGSILPRHDQILGRSDDMIIYRAVNIYPGQIDAVLSATEGIGSEYQIMLDRQDDGKDLMTIRVERALGMGDHLDNELSLRIKSQIKRMNKRG